MSFNFAAFLVLATFMSGAVWGIYALLKRRRAVAGTPEETGKADYPVIVEYCRSFFPVFLVVLLLRSFVVEPFRIPSASMMPTLVSGDFILVNKYNYGLRLPVLDTKIAEIGRPERGDVIVFRYPKQENVDYIKRVVGIPGDHVAYYNKILYINGNPVDQDDLGLYEGMRNVMRDASLRKEGPSDNSHLILVENDRRGQDFEYRVKDDEYFVLGDNRDNSNDSRYWGPVPEKNLVGRASMIWMSWNSESSSVSWSRIGTSIK